MCTPEAAGGMSFSAKAEYDRIVGREHGNK